LAEPLKPAGLDLSIKVFPEEVAKFGMYHEPVEKLVKFVLEKTPDPFHRRMVGDK
jgi:hypothetical protein